MKIAFEPPSDYVPSAKGGGKSKIWMILGGGCLVLLLLIGGLFAAGAFKAVSCCNQLQDVAARTMAAQQFALGWGTQVGAGDLDAAYQALTEAERQKTDINAFKALFAEDSKDLAASLPQLFNTNAVHHEAITDVKAWRISLQYATPSAHEMLVLSFDVTLVDPEANTFGIEGIDLDKRARVMGSEAPAREVLQFHEELQAGRYEMAYGRLPQQFKDSTSLETFRAFLDNEGSVLIGSTLEIGEISYPEPNRATVMAIATRVDKKAVVQYELQSPTMPGIQMWQIMAISPTLQTNPTPELEDEGASDGGESDGATPSDEMPENP